VLEVQVLDLDSHKKVTGLSRLKESPLWYLDMVFFLIYFPVYINKQNKTTMRCSLASRHVIDIVIPKNSWLNWRHLTVFRQSKHPLSLERNHYMIIIVIISNYLWDFLKNIYYGVSKYSWLSLSRIRWDHEKNSSQPYFDSRGATKIPEVWFV
jgi:hypothetical protein